MQQQQVAQFSQKDPKFAMYSRETIKDHLDRRRRRAQSTARPRQRFSTITALHKTDVHAVTPGGHEHGMGKRRTSAISHWSSNMNTSKQLEYKTQKFLPFNKIGAGPSYTIPNQNYASRPSPTKADTTPRDMIERAVSSQSPNNLIS